jgi:hypothetical protein
MRRKQNQAPPKEKKMEKTLKWMLYAGAVAVCITLTPSAHAGCGRPVLPGLLQAETAQAQTAEPRASQPGTPAATYQTIVGLWLSTVTVDGQPFAQGFEAFTSDGIEILNDNGAPQAGNVCLGVWAPTGRNTLTINHPSWNYDNNGNVIGTVVIKSQIAISSSGNTYQGTVMIDIYDLNGNKVAPTTVGQLTAKRITAN